MKRILAFLVVIAVVLTACKKDEPINTPPQEVDVEFIIQETDFGGLKSTNDDVPLCVNDPWVTIEFTITKADGVTVVGNYTSPVITMADGSLLTKVIKLAPGNYKLTKFIIKNAGGAIVRAAPEPGGDFHSLMEHPLNLDIVVGDFVKKQYIVDVLCFEGLYYTSFGFTWFVMNDVKIERQCFFGDICVDDLAPYTGSKYDADPLDPQMDMPAIMKIEVFKQNADGTWPGPGEYEIYFDNEGNFSWDGSQYNGFNGAGDCMEVFWANDLGITETFRFDLYVWLPDAGGYFDWVPINTGWEFTDENCPNAGTDGVVDYVMGDCQISDADYQFDYNDPDPPTWTCGDPLGYNGKSYETVQIDGQCWMKENLATTKYKDGTDISLVTDNTAWAALTAPAYCWYENDEATYGGTYGALYNWFTVETGNLCPTGWHVASDDEWKTLEMYLGMSSADADLPGWYRGTDEGEKLKSTSGWNGSGNGTDVVGFSALPGNFRNVSGIFPSPGSGSYGTWWTATEYSTKAMQRALTNDLNTVARGTYDLQGGLSVRCLKD